MTKIVITEKHILFITLGISLVSLGIGIYNIYSINSILKTLSPYSSLSKINLPSISQINPIYGNSQNIIVFEYLDYLCPYCAMFDVETFPELEKNYIKNGKITYIVKNWIIHGDEAKNLAKIAICIYLGYGLDEFLNFKHSLYAALYDAVFVKKNYTVFEESLNNTLSKYDISGCINNQNFTSGMERSFSIDFNEAKTYNLIGTPGFVILIKKDILPDAKLKDILSMLDKYKNYGLEYSVWLSNDERYVIISFAGALPIDFFNAIFSSI